MIGTGDDGWAFSCCGALLLTFPDIAILAAATGDVITKRKGMETGGGNLSAILAILPAEHLMRFDFSATWDQDPLFALDGSGEAEFHDDRPLEWMVAIGKKPPSGKPVSARALKLGGSYMLSADYWFRIDAARSANIGMTTGIGWRFGPPGLHVDLVAQVSGDVTLAWNPAQLEGDFGILGRARLVGGGLSLAVNVRASPSLKIACPTELVIPLKACIELDLGLKRAELCLAFTIAWLDRKPPRIEDLVHGLSTVPRHWSPRLTGYPNAPYDSGIVQQLLDANHQTVDGAGAAAQ